MYKSLSIHEKKDIDISFQDIGDILNINNSKRIGLIIKEIEKLILKNKIRNKKSEIIKYLKENKDRWMA